MCCIFKNYHIGNPHMETEIPIWKRTAIRFHMGSHMETVTIWGLTHILTRFHMGILIDNPHIETGNAKIPIWKWVIPTITRFHMGI
jgi:hypothetical protein